MSATGREHFAKVPRTVILRAMAADQCMDSRLRHAMILWSWCGPEIDRKNPDRVVRKDAKGFIVRDDAGAPIPATLKDLGDLLGIERASKAMVTRTAQALEAQKLMRFEGRVMYLEPNPPKISVLPKVDLQVNFHFGRVDVQVNQLPDDPNLRGDALQWLEKVHATFKNERNAFLAKWLEYVCNEAPKRHILIDEKKKSYEKRDEASGRSSSVRNSGVASGLIVRPPAPPPSIRETLKTWLIATHKLPTAPDDRILEQIAAHIPDVAALAQFQAEAAKVRPRSWAVFVKVAKDCEAHRSQYAAAGETPMRSNERTQIDRMNRIHATLKAKTAKE